MPFDWAKGATVLAVLAPLVGIPLTVITFHLKSLREQYASRFDDLITRLAALETSGERLRIDINGLNRDGVSKEEWLRESMWMRGSVTTLNDRVTRAESSLEQLAIAPATAERAVRAVTELTHRIDAQSVQAAEPVSAARSVEEEVE